MDDKEILELRSIIFAQGKYSIDEAKAYLRQMADETAINSALRGGKMKGYRMKKFLDPWEMFKVVYICLEMTHNPELQKDAEEVNCKIRNLEARYL